MSFLKQMGFIKFRNFNKKECQVANHQISKLELAKTT